jgi:hypothetical protein
VKIIPYLESVRLISDVMFDRILVYSAVICYRRVKDPFESAGAERGCFESVAVFVLPISESSGQIRLLAMSTTVLFGICVGDCHLT